MGLPRGPEGQVSVMTIALRRPFALPHTATMGEVRRYLARAHVHLALLVAPDGILRSCIDRDDVAAAQDLPDDAPAAALGSLEGRTVSSDADAGDVGSSMARDGIRRVAVVDAQGRLVGLVCRKRSGTGFCSDDGVAARRAERHRGT